MSRDAVRYTLPEAELPTHWINLLPDLPGDPLPPLNPRTMVAQAYENKRAGARRLSTEIGAGQWGSALALACRLFGLDCVIYMVGASYDQKRYRRSTRRSPPARPASGA